MDNASKQSSFNNSAYGARLAEKQALYKNSKYANVQSTISKTSSTTTKYALDNGKVLVRNPKSSKIDFKTLFASMHDDIDNTVSISNFKNITDNILKSRIKQSNTYLYKSTNS